MPTDVPLGAGYVGAILEERFPNQYRDPRLDVPTFGQDYYQFPGAVVGQPRFTDPDHGHQLVLQEIPGVGQVVVPVDHTVGQVVNVEQRMADMGQARPSYDPLPVVVAKLTRVAVYAAKQAIEAIKAGTFTKMAQFEHYVKDRTHAAAAEMAKLWSAHPTLRKLVNRIPPIREKVLQEVFEVYRPLAHELLKKNVKSGVNDWPGSMMGVSDMGALAGADYGRVTALQNAVTIRNAELNAVGAAVWDTIWAQMQGKTIPNTQTWFLGFAFTQGEINKALNRLIVTVSRVPSSDDLAFGETVARDVGTMVAFAAKMAPEIKAKIEADSASMQAKLKNIPVLQDPAQVGWDTFKKVLAERAAALAGEGINLTKYALIAAAVIGAAIVVSKVA